MPPVAGGGQRRRFGTIRVSPAGRELGDRFPPLVPFSLFLALSSSELGAI